jgi:hypothetical protein
VAKQGVAAMIVEQLVAALRDPANRERPPTFPKDPSVAAQPGLYCWYCDADGGAALGALLGHAVGPLIYAGLAGEVKSVDRTAKATLLSRIRGMHLSGPLEFSTFRTTLAALLRTPLELSLRKRGYLDAPSDARLTSWMHAHLQIATVAYPDRVTLAVAEHDVLLALDPPLNLRGMSATATRARLKILRSELAHAAPAL